MQKAEFAKCKFMHFILCDGLAHNHHLLLLPIDDLVFMLIANEAMMDQLLLSSFPRTLFVGKTKSKPKEKENTASYLIIGISNLDEDNLYGTRILSWLVFRVVYIRFPPAFFQVIFSCL